MQWRFFLKPRWLVGHVVVIVMVGVMLFAAHWQWDRLQSKKTFNRETAAAMAAEPVALTAENGLSQLPEYQRVRATGTWDNVHTVYVRYPAFDGVQGYYVLTPLRTAHGFSILVNRGWVPKDQGKAASLPGDDTPSVTVTGYVIRDVETSKATNKNEGSPPIPTVSAIDPSALQPLVGFAFEGWMQQQTPVIADAPKVLPAPELNEGSHYSYTLQWLAFSIVTLVGYGILLQRAEREARTQPV